MIKKLMVWCLIFVFIYPTLCLSAFIAIKNPIINETKVKAEIEMIGGTGSTTSQIIKPGEVVELPETLSIIEIKAVFDVNNDNKTGLAEIIYLLQIVSGSKTQEK